MTPTPPRIMRVLLVVAAMASAACEKRPTGVPDLKPWRYLEWLVQNTPPSVDGKVIRYTATERGRFAVNRLVRPVRGEPSGLLWYLVRLEPSLGNQVWVIVTEFPRDPTAARPRSRSHLVALVEGEITWVQSFDD